MARVKEQRMNPIGTANMVDLAIQPYTTKYKKVVEDMGDGIERTTIVAVKDDD